MSKTKDGSPAFPRLVSIGEKTLFDGGLTKREYYATHLPAGESLNQAMGEIIAGRVMPSIQENPVGWFEFWFEVEAKLRFMKADAMIAASKEGGGE